MFPARAESIRRDLIQRAHAQRSDAMERGSVSHGPSEASTAGDTTQNTTQQDTSRTSRLARLFSRPLDLVRNSGTVAGGSRQGPETPKTPDTPRPGSRTQENARPRNEGAERRAPGIVEPPPAIVAASDPSSDAGTQQRQSANHRSRRRGIVEKMQCDGTKRFLCCLPWIKSGRVRVTLVHSLTSGLFVVLLLAVYLGLSLTQHVQTSELTILLLLIIVTSALFFCYNMMRLCLAVKRGDRPVAATRGRPAMNPADMLRTGYAVPRRPIRVVLAQDEEVAGREEVTNKLTPPAYGFWRESVRLDPDRLYWQRNEAARLEEAVPETESEHAPAAPGTRRPPSYVSEDGVSYVVDAMSASSTGTTTASRGQMAR